MMEAVVKATSYGFRVEVPISYERAVPAFSWS